MPRRSATHCTTCGVELTDETASRSRTGTFRSACRACAAKYTRGWSQRSLAATDVCSVCAGSGVLTPKGRVRLDATDRDPETGELRGLLCPGCRAAVAAVSRDPERLRRAAAYLDRKD